MKQTYKLTWGKSRCVCVGLLWLALNSSAWSGVHRCVEPDGKIVFNDRPCVTEQAASSQQAQAHAATGNAPAKIEAKLDPGVTEQALRAAAIVRIRAAQTPDCLALGDRIVAAANNTALAQAPDMGEVVARYSRQCASRATAATQAEAARRQTEQKRLQTAAQVGSACAEKRQTLDAQRAKFDTLSSQDKVAWARLLEETSRECNK